jgi:hypothetical protein
MLSQNVLPGYTVAQGYNTCLGYARPLVPSPALSGENVWFQRFGFQDTPKLITCNLGEYYKIGMFS